MTRAHRKRSVVPIHVVTLFLCVACMQSAAANERDTTIVVFNREHMDSPHRVATSRVQFPPLSERYERVAMRFTLECPRNGCDPWDRVAYVRVVRNRDTVPLDDYPGLFYNDDNVTISKIVTPYGKGWSWDIDVTDYRSLLTDSTTMLAYLATYMGDGKGFLLSTSITFLAGEPDIEPISVQNLWNDEWEYGNPAAPIADSIQLLQLNADTDADFVMVRSLTTGHGQGNTDNAGEFARKWHEVVVNGVKRIGHYLWRDDCGSIAAGSQYGTWEESRAGFCPGADVIPWDVDITPYITRGKTYTLDYEVEPYENKCHPGANPCPCGNCQYNGLDHTKPIYSIYSQAISYRIVPVDSKHTLENIVTVEDVGGGRFRIASGLEKGAPLHITVSDVTGAIYFRQERTSMKGQAFVIDLSTTPGVYLLKIESGDRLMRKRIEVL